MSEKFMVYCDMDGVLTDFSKAVIDYYNGDFLKQYPEFPKTKARCAYDLHNALGNRWYKVTETAPREYWSEMPWMTDGRVLWNHINQLDPIILSTPAQTDHCKVGKREWVAKQLGDQVDVILAYDKQLYVTDDTFVPSTCLNRRRILIDDMPKKIDKWVEAGGIGILHDNAASTISSLNKLMFRS
ncbi:hypothetical protein MJH12_10155 [bacterium]|nr:hypothetical protein [bacterium]